MERIIKAGEEAAVLSLPDCQLCKHLIPTGAPQPAIVDGKTWMGPWAYMCEGHFDQFGVGIGLGKGQRLIVVDGSHTDSEV